MTVLLDTSVLSEPLKKLPDLTVVQRLIAALDEGAFTATIVVHEMAYGVARLPSGRRRRRLAVAAAELLDLVEALPYDLGAARWHAAERVRLERLGRTPSYADAQIAAVAAANGLAVVTRNPRHFEDLDVPVERW